MAAAHLCGGHAGAIKRKSPSANAGAFADGDFLYVCIKQAQKLSARQIKQLARQFKLLSQLFSATRRADKKIRRRKFSRFKYIFLILHRSQSIGKQRSWQRTTFGTQGSGVRVASFRPSLYKRLSVQNWQPFLDNRKSKPRDMVVALGLPIEAYSMCDYLIVVVTFEPTVANTSYPAGISALEPGMSMQGVKKRAVTTASGVRFLP